MMTDLEHVNVAEHPPVDEWLEHVTLRVAGQHRREAGRCCQQDDARLVAGRVLNGRSRRLHRQLETPH
jgi:hypothetical protein